MAIERITVDSNILVYAVDHDAGDRHRRAAEILDRCVDLDSVLTLQALGEFYFVATRKDMMPHKDAAAQVEDWQVLFPIALPRPRTLTHAIAGVKDHSLSFWDAMLWAVAAEHRVTNLISEDYQSGWVLEGVRFVNPFEDSTAETMNRILDL